MVLGDLAERMRLFCVASMQRCVRDTPGKTVANVEARKGAIGSVCDKHGYDSAASSIQDVSALIQLMSARHSMCQH